MNSLDIRRHSWDRLARWDTLLIVSGQCLHAFDEAVWPHVSPVLLDEFKTRGTRIRLVDNPPTIWHLDEGWPKRMLPLVVDQYMVDAIFVFERISGHLALH